MKQKFEQQIHDIEKRFPDWVLYGRKIDIPLQQQERMQKLITRLRDQLNQFNFELFIKIMGDKEYNTQIYYDNFKTFNQTWDFDEAEWDRLRAPIPELQRFFEGSEHTHEKKKAIEEIIIFAIFLQATHDFFCASPHGGHYFYLLDNLSYKCNPTAYKLLTSLNYIALWLVLSSLIIIPLAVPLMFCPPLLAGLLGTLLILVLFVSPAASFVYSIWDNTADRRWGTNWAYPLPMYATDNGPKSRDLHPYTTGIFPSFFDYPEIPGGSSFKAMNRLGFFPFKEIANEVIAVAKRKDEETCDMSEMDIDKFFADLPNPS